jgi:dTMP kinase
MTKRGKFITIEGVEGSGKTTQAALLADYLRRQEVAVIETREPGGTKVGENIRKMLLSPLHHDLGAMTELLLFLAARAQLIDEIIRPALDSGKWVLCDRFFDATLAYQGYGRGIDIKSIRKMNELATGGIKPDLTFLLDLDIDTGIKRAVAAKKEFSNSAGGDRLENENKEFHRRVRAGYLELARLEPDRIKVIPVSGSIEDVHKILVKLIEPFLMKVS